jgi:hypothetical protein
MAFIRRDPVSQEPFSSRRYDLCYTHCEISLRSKHELAFDGLLMKAVTARVTRKNFFVILLGLLSAFSLESSVWPYSVTQNQNCSGNCESHERLAAFTQTKTLDARTVSFTPADRISALQSADLASGADVQAATSGSTLSNTDQVPTSTQALKNPGTEGGSTPGPSFFLLIGLALIGVRLVISYRSRKVKNLATQTH